MSKSRILCGRVRTVIRWGGSAIRFEAVGCSERMRIFIDKLDLKGARRDIRQHLVGFHGFDLGVQDLFFPPDPLDVLPIPELRTTGELPDALVETVPR